MSATVVTVYGFDNVIKIVLAIFFCKYAFNLL